MNLGRRKFLKFVGMALAGTAIDPLSIIIENNNYYVNQKLGFGFIIPDHWKIDAFTSFDSLKGKQIINEVKGHSTRELLSDLSENLVAVIRKYPEPELDSFTPGITFYMAPDDDLKNYASFETFVAISIEAFGSLLRYFEVFEKPTWTSGSNFEAYRLKTSYLFEHERFEPIKIEDEFLIVHHDDILYSIHLFDSPGAGENCANELTIFKNSLHIA